MKNIFSFNGTRKKSEGYVALVAAILVSAIMLTMAFTLSFGSYVNLFGSVAAEYKERSRGLAEACLDVARLNLSSNGSYAGQEVVTVGSSTCQIGGISATSTGKIIPVYGSYNEASTTLQVIVSGTNQLVDWREL